MGNPVEHKIQYRRLRVPASHGESLQSPSLSHVDQAWNQNLNWGKSTNASSIASQHFDIQTIRETARADLLRLATQYTLAYRDLEFSQRSADQIVMSGHQPSLFHPGVWFKNFALSNLGKHFGATAINLVVDNDICGINTIRVPYTQKEKTRWLPIPLDAAGQNIPFEQRTILDANQFASFDQRASMAIAPMVAAPLVNQFWKYAVQASERDPRIGASVAAARHRFEQDLGLQTLEVPISKIATTRGFAEFSHEVIARLPEFQQTYNQSLEEYRQTHRIRSSAHPVPALEHNEAPFWIWDQNNPVRRRLFVESNGQTFTLTDRELWRSDLNDTNFEDQFLALAEQGVAIRPRALMTTMFSRLVLSDLFLHGIGGSKYDQLTDAIMARFFQTSPPEFLTLSATMKLPFDEPLFASDDLTRLRIELRELTYHPERHAQLDDESDSAAAEEMQAAIQSKRDWISREILPDQKLERHHAIEHANQQLQRFVSSKRMQLAEKRNYVSSRIRSDQILGSRECSFCLFPESLVDELAAMAEVS